MRHLIVSAAVLLAGPAMAVDYVKCEAMNNANRRLHIQWDQETTQLAIEIRERKKVEKCGLEPNVSAPSFGGWIRCGSGISAYRTNADREIAEVPINEKYNTKLNALKADLEKEGCP